MRPLLSRVRRRREASRELPVRNIAGTELEVDTWAISQFVLWKVVPLVGTHPFPLHELMLMAAAVCRFQPPMVFEWGTHIGKSARVFYEVAEHYGVETEIHSTDLPDDIDHPEHPRGERGRLVRGLSRVHQHRGDGVEVSLALWRAAGERPNPLFFLDGDHAFETVERELTSIASAAPRATIIVHDTFFQSPGSGYNIGPHQAIEAFLARAPGSYRRQDSGLGLPGMTLLYASP